MLQKAKFDQVINFFIFVMSGGTAAISNITSRHFFSEYFSYSLSIFFAYWVGMLVAFTLFRSLVFQSGNIAKSFPKFILINIGMIALTILISNASLHLLELVNFKTLFFADKYLIAHMVGVSSPIAPSYFLHKYFTFKN